MGGSGIHFKETRECYHENRRLSYKWGFKFSEMADKAAKEVTGNIRKYIDSTV